MSGGSWKQLILGSTAAREMGRRYEDTRKNGTLDAFYSRYCHARSKSRLSIPRCQTPLDRPPRFRTLVRGMRRGTKLHTPLATRRSFGTCSLSIEMDIRVCGVLLLSRCLTGAGRVVSRPLSYVSEGLRSVVSAGCAPHTVGNGCASHARCDASWQSIQLAASPRMPSPPRRRATRERKPALI